DTGDARGEQRDGDRRFAGARRRIRRLDHETVADVSGHTAAAGHDAARPDRSAVTRLLTLDPAALVILNLDVAVPLGLDAEQALEPLPDEHAPAGVGEADAAGDLPGPRADVDAVVVDIHVESIEARIVELQVEDGVVGVQRAVAEDEPVHGGGAAELDGDGGAGLLAADGAEAGAGAHGQV